MAVFAIGCATPEARRPTFDARCECEGKGEAKESEAASRDDVYQPDESLLDDARARLAADDPLKSAAVVAYLAHPEAFEKAVRKDLDRQRPAAERRAEHAATEAEADLLSDLADLRDAIEEAKNAGDAQGASEAQSLLWWRYDEGARLVHARIVAAARSGFPLSRAAVDATCAYVVGAGLEGIDVPTATKTMLVCERLAPFLGDVHARMRDAVVEQIAGAIVAARRPRWVAAITK